MTEPIRKAHNSTEVPVKETGPSMLPHGTNQGTPPASSSVEDKSPPNIVDPVVRAEEFAQEFRSMVFSSWQVAMVASLILIRIRRKEPLPSHEEVKTLVRIGALGIIPPTAAGTDEGYHERLAEILSSVDRKDVLHRG
jgi:hypothetical protein